jgi:hypothetical protein
MNPKKKEKISARGGSAFGGNYERRERREKK